MLMALGLIALVGSVAAIIAFWIEPRRTIIKELNVITPHWHGASFRIAFVSDIHIDGFHVTTKRIKEIVKKTKELNPDIVFLGGDYLGGYFSYSHPPNSKFENRTTLQNILQQEAILSLNDFANIAPLGAVAIMGNHDCWWSCEKTREAFAKTKLVFLENKSLLVKNDKFDFQICGLEDTQTQNPDYRLACEKEILSKNQIVLAHNPNEFKPYLSRAKIQFSGHLHGGQVRFPLIGAPITSGPFTKETKNGFMIDRDRVLIVSSGIGMVGLPIRFNVPPEIMLVTISSGEKLEIKMPK